jgi:hypothetical protein
MSNRMSLRGRMSRYLVTCGAIPLACIGGLLTLAGSCVGGGWIAALLRGASAAQLPEPTAIVYPILMLGAGVVSLLLSGLFLVASRWVRR